jgi:hypothetical protein
MARSARIAPLSISISRVESTAEGNSFVEVIDAEIRTDTVYQTENLDDYSEDQKTTFYTHVISEAADQPAWRSLFKYCCQVGVIR